MKDKTETPPTEGKVVRRGLVGETAEPATVGTETSAAAVAELEAELANLRLLIRRQDEVVDRLLSERSGSGSGGATVKAVVPTARRAKRSTRRGLLTQMAAGAAGVAAAAMYGVSKSGTANAEYFGTNVGTSTPAWGLYAVPNGVAPIDITGSKAGVWGQADNSAPNPLVTAGVIGISNSFAGVRGQSNQNVGVFGTTSGGSVVPVAGVAGTATNVNSLGVWGIHNASGGVAVRGDSANGATARGVHGISNQGTGVRGDSTSGPGVHGESTHGLGVRGVSTNSTAMVGISTNGHGLYGSTSGAASAGFVGENLAGGLAGYFAGNVFITGGLQVAGAKNAVIKMQDGTLGSVYCQESPEPYFEDFGKGQMAGGVASVTLEREFATLVGGGEYLVYLTPEGDTRGVFVSRKGPGGFEVRENQGGTSSVPFTYRIVTKRKDIEGRRFARVVDTVAPGLAAAREAMGVGAPTSNQPVPQPPTQPQSPAPPAPQPEAPLPVQPPANNQPPPSSAGPSSSGLIRP